jgi:tetratricopeptide (TPR) repeat protein
MFYFKELLIAVTVAGFLAPGWSADTGPSVSVDVELTKARELVASKNWSAATPALAAYVKANPGSADGFNLLGYSLRHLKKYDESLAAYQQALKLDPRHKGAHEYIGVAYVEMKQLDKAREHLAALDKICRFSYEEYRDLKKAIESAAK